MKITPEQIRHIASLARLRIDDAEVEKWSAEMSAIVDFADKLNELDVSAAPDAAVPETDGPVNIFREDVRAESYPRDKMLANAPKQYDGCWIVPKIVE